VSCKEDEASKKRLLSPDKKLREAADKRTRVLSPKKPLGTRNVQSKAYPTLSKEAPANPFKEKKQPLIRESKLVINSIFLLRVMGQK
jgi:hypothetical protein